MGLLSCGLGLGSPLPVWPLYCGRVFMQEVSCAPVVLAGVLFFGVASALAVLRGCFGNHICLLSSLVGCWLLLWWFLFVVWSVCWCLLFG